MVRAFRWPVDGKTAFGMIAGGTACMLGWRYGLGLSDSVYEVLPGMAGGFLFYLVLKPSSVKAPEEGMVPRQWASPPD